MIQINFKRYGLYLLRWQLSTPILAPIMAYLHSWHPFLSAGVANLIGGLLFFWVDMFIFKSAVLDTQWEVKENVSCVDCGRITRGYRLVKTENYNKLKDKKPEFRCEMCSQIKTSKLILKGIRGLKND